MNIKANEVHEEAKNAFPEDRNMNNNLFRHGAPKGLTCIKQNYQMCVLWIRF